MARLCATGPGCGSQDRVRGPVGRLAGGAGSPDSHPARWSGSGPMPRRGDPWILWSPRRLRVALRLVYHAAGSLPAAAFGVAWPPLLQSAPASEGEPQTCPSRDPVVLQGRFPGRASSSEASAALHPLLVSALHRSGTQLCSPSAASSPDPSH